MGWLHGRCALLETRRLTPALLRLAKQASSLRSSPYLTSYLQPPKPTLPHERHERDCRCTSRPKQNDRWSTTPHSFGSGGRHNPNADTLPRHLERKEECLLHQFIRPPPRGPKVFRISRRSGCLCCVLPDSCISPELGGLEIVNARHQVPQ